MTQEEKRLLLVDLSARLPYEPMLHICDGVGILEERLTPYILSNLPILFVQPYLRPMSSMTKEEKDELLNLLFDKEAKYFYVDKEGLIDGKTSYLMKEGLNYPAFCPINIVLYTDWLNAHHLDYRGLIPMGLAIEVTKENNPYKINGNNYDN